MAIDPNSLPKELRAASILNRTALPVSSPSDPPATGPFSRVFVPGASPAESLIPPPPWGGVGGGGGEGGGGGGDAADEPLRAGAAAKVKLLCGYGGRILPRPSDGALRYVCGHTRLISVAKDVSFADFMRKMAGVVRGNEDGEPDDAGAVAVKYQLPGEDLDALVSVSCAEDLENMIEEHDKVAAAAPDGSAKLRVFLFTPADAAADPGAHLGGADETSQRYIEAVNGVAAAPDAAGGAVRRKESVASAASSTQNSDGAVAGEAADGNIEGVSSPSLRSPTVAASDEALKMAYVGGGGGGSNPVAFVDSSGGYFGGNASGLGTSFPVQNPSLVWQDQPSFPVHQAYVDPHQVQYVNPQQMGIGGGAQPVHVVPVQMNPYMSGRVPITAAMPASQVGNLKPAQARVEYAAENPYGGRPVQPSTDQSHKALQPLSQFPPLPPAYLQQQNTENYGMQQGVPPPPANSATLKYDDCAMCQKALPHVHSETMIQGGSSPSSTTEPSPVFYSQRSEDPKRGPNLGGAVGSKVGEPRIASAIPASQLGVYAFSQNPETHVSMRPAVQGSETVDPSRVLIHQVVTSNGAFLSNILESHGENSYQQHWQTLQPVQLHYDYGVKQGVFSKQPGVDASQVKNVNFQPSDPIQDHVAQFPIRYVQAVDGRIQALHLGHAGNSESHRLAPSGFASDGKVDSSPLVSETSYTVRPQVGGHATLTGDPNVSSAFISPENYVKPVEQWPPVTFEVTGMQSVQPSMQQETILIGNQGPFPNNLGVGIDPSAPKERLLVRPVYAGVNAPLYSGTNLVAMPDQKDEAPKLHPGELFNNFAVPSSGNAQFPGMSSTIPTEPISTFQESNSSNSLFSNQDPWKVLESTHLPPPKPSILANKEPIVAKDSYAENHLGTCNGSNIVSLLEEGNVPHISDFPNKDSTKDLVQVTEGSGEERVRQQLQAVAEGVAASVLQSPVPSDPSFYPRETNKATAVPDKNPIIVEDNIDSGRGIVDPKSENTKGNQLDKTSPGIPISDDIGRLQIIKNSDLEVLRELGSGNFGTVYHGKWRGSDVAIKRINDRCFSGKASEQERMRADFWNEASKLADLHHPNVVAFYGVVLDGPEGAVATVTEYMVNGSLRQALQRNDKILDRRKRLLIAMDVAFGMEYLHGKNIVHFDLKSDNLLVNLRDPQRPICKVGDLGLSKVKRQTLISGGVRGTLPWMAPELLNGSSSLVSEKVDVYSFGIVMWELLTGDEPYADLHYGAIIGGIVSNTLRPPVPDSCDRDWRSLMEQCWLSEPSERPSFTEIANRLRSMGASLSQKGQAQAQK
ncbi:uncharacterized protein LOC109711492 [Ananas comosus]|uniref:Uncharacterized protein LOC109711492 n=1 Tax=Ananas comosus TaxID=4615 RepID=A0A6P5F2J2_ANACO|nr:uncharacterized protein LOC109711492 [Ananas comosus]